MEDFREQCDAGLADLLAIAEADVRTAATDEEKAEAVKRYTELYDRYVKSVQLDQDSSEAADKYLEEYRKHELEKEKLEGELKHKEEEVKVAKREGWIKLGLGVLGTALPLYVQNLWMKRMWKAEEFGAVTKQTSRAVFQNLLRFGKK